MNASPRGTMKVNPPCKECKFLALHAGSGAYICRKLPPTVHAAFVPNGAGSVQAVSQTFWPIVTPDLDWCGDFTPVVQQ